jgi:hypothetical protein
MIYIIAGVVGLIAFFIWLLSAWKDKKKTRRSDLSG